MKRYWLRQLFSFDSRYSGLERWDELQRFQKLDDRALLIRAQRSKYLLRFKRFAKVVEDSLTNGCELAMMEVIRCIARPPKPARQELRVAGEESGGTSGCVLI